jgi:hypothetical protein
MYSYMSEVLIRKQTERAEKLRLEFYPAIFILTKEHLVKSIVVSIMKRSELTEVRRKPPDNFSRFTHYRSRDHLSTEKTSLRGNVARRRWKIDFACVLILRHLIFQVCTVLEEEEVEEEKEEACL